MKFFSVIAFSLLLSMSASAYTTTQCSNASGTVVWDQGLEDKVTLAYSGFVPGALELQYEQVAIKFSNEKTISEEDNMSCGASSQYARTFTADVVIKAADKSPNIFQSYFPKSEVRATVICEYFSNNRINCSQD